MDVNVFNSTLNLLFPVTEWNYVIQLTIGIISLLFCLILAFIVEKHTPEDFCSKKTMLLINLAGCFSNSLLYSFLQPFPIYPHKVFMFTGPFHSFGWEITSIIFVAWTGVQTFLSCAVMTSFNHYIETMEQFKQRNVIFEFFRNLTISRRLFAYALFNIIIVTIASATLFLSIDHEKDESLVGGIFDFLRENYGMINFKSKYGTLEILVGSFVFFVIFYAGMVFCLKKSVWTELEDLRPSLSPRTFDILVQLSRLLITANLTPAVFFFLPTGIFILIPVLLPSLVSTPGLLIFFTLLTISLFSIYSYVYYFLILLGFKYYRRALYDILIAPIAYLRPSIAIRDVTSSKPSL